MSIATLLEWFFYGLIRYILLWVPLVNPFPVDRAIPNEWWFYNDFLDWLHRDDVGGGPDEQWLQAWFRMVWGEAKKLVNSEAQRYTDAAKQWLRDRIGYIKSGWANLGSWLLFVEQRIGSFLPSFAPTVSEGLNWLRSRLPETIRNLWQSWDQLFDSIKQSVEMRIRSLYERTKEWAAYAYDWVIAAGRILDAWRQRVQGFLDALRNDPYGTVTGWLGEAWQWLREFRNRGRDQVLEWLGPDIGPLLTFARDCVVFYYNLWSLGWQELGAFVEHPGEWLYDRAERILINRW